jgi:hypothetical protein
MVLLEVSSANQNGKGLNGKGGSKNKFQSHHDLGSYDLPKSLLYFSESL